MHFQSILNHSIKLKVSNLIFIAHISICTFPFNRWNILQNIVCIKCLQYPKNFKQVFILRQVNWRLAPLSEGIWENCKHWGRAVERVVLVFQDYALKRWPSANILKQGVKICKFLMNSCTFKFKINSNC